MAVAPMDPAKLSNNLLEVAAAERPPGQLAYDPSDPAYQNNISSIYAALTLNSIIGGACLVGFFILQTFTKQYRLRSVLNYVTIKPPPLPTKGLGLVFGWVREVFRTSDVWLLHSAGLDALVMVKCQAMCLQLFLPIVVVGCCVILPIQLSEGYEDGDSTFSRLTMANVDPQSGIMWAHWIVTFIYLGWTLLLLEYHFREYVALRQFYLKGGDGYNFWRELHMAEADGVSVQKQDRFADVVETARMDSILQMMAKHNVAQPRSWWREKMAWLTSWTGSGTPEDVMELAQQLTASDADSAAIRKLRSKQLVSRPSLSPRSILPSVDEADPEPPGEGADRSRKRHHKPRHQQQEHHQQQKEQKQQQQQQQHDQERRRRRRRVQQQGEQQQQEEQQRQEEQQQQQDQGQGQDQQGAPGKPQPTRGRHAALQLGPSHALPERDAEPTSGSVGGGNVVAFDVEQPRPQPRPKQQQADGDASATAPASAMEEVTQLAAPKWWSTVDVVTTEDGKMRRLTEEEREQMKGQNLLLAKPSVRYRKTINTQGNTGRPMAVHAQQYAVLVTNVHQPVYPEFFSRKPTLGAGPCGVPRVKHGVDDVWLGARYRRLADALQETDAARSAAIISGPAAAAAVEASKALAAFEAVMGAPADVETGSGPDRSSKDGKRRSSSGGSHAPGGGAAHARSAPHLTRATVSAGRVAELWAAARAAMRDGRLKKLLHDERYSIVSAVFSSLFPDDFDRVVPVFNFRETDLLMRKWDAKLQQLEVAEHAKRLSGKPAMMTPPGGSAQVDRIEWLRAEVQRLERAVLESRERALVFNSTPSFFVLFRTQKAAAIASSCNIHPLRKELFKVHPAPGPEEVNWEALWFTYKQRVVRGFFVTPLIVTVVLLPVSLIGSAMTQLNDAFCAPTNTTLKWVEYCTSKSQVFQIIKALLTGFFPALLVNLWQGLLMPRLVFWAAQSEARHYSLSDLDRRMGGIYFMWSFLNFFVGGVVGSTILARVPELVMKPFNTPELLGYALPASAKFFFTYMILRTFMSLPLRFLLPHPGVWQAWIRFALRPIFPTLRDEGAAERTLYSRSAISSPAYGIDLGGNSCLVILICFAFAVICPLVALFGVAYFAGDWLYWRYQFIYGIQRKYESGGRFFPFVADRVLFSAAVMVTFTGCVMIIKSAWTQASLMWVIGLVSIYAYYKRTRDLYIHGMREMPLMLAQMAPRARVPSTVYVPPPLQQSGFLWHPEWLTCWAGMPSYSL